MINLLNDVSKNKCKTGLFFRGVKSYYKSTNGISIKFSLNLLKRKSCKCSSCLGLLDMIYEDIDNKCLPIGFENIENNKLYGIRVINDNVSYYGELDDYEIEIFERKDNKL